MNTVERVIRICKARKIAISKLEADCGFGNGYVKSLQKGTFPQDRLVKIAEYLELPIDYLLGVRDKYGLIPDQWDVIGHMFKDYAFDNGKSVDLTAADTGIDEKRIDELFEIGIPTERTELLQICMAWNIPLEKVIWQYAKRFEKSESPSEDGEISDEQLKFALFGDAAPEITDAQLNDVKRYAKFIINKG